MTLNVNEIFYTIQGEGPKTGIPSIFIRLAGCNLRCIWCDTKYTWLYSQNMLDNLLQTVPTDKHHLTEKKYYDKDEESSQMKFSDILSEIDGYKGRHVVITGGEPLLQKKHLIDFTTQLLELGYSIEIETNGTIAPTGLPEAIRFNVSPKLENSYNAKERRYLPAVLEKFLQYDSIFKFVISDKTDTEEVDSIIADIDIPPDKVYLMPEGKTRSELEDKALWLMELCKELNYNYSHRLHIELYGDKRGV